MSIQEIKEKVKGSVTIDKNMRDYSNEPFFKKKKEDAIAFLKKHNLFETLSKKK